MEKNGIVGFRRIRGRVIPIRARKGDAPQVGKGLALVGLGTGTAAASGLAASQITKLAAHVRQRSSFEFRESGRVLRGLRGPQTNLFAELGASIGKTTQNRKAAVSLRGTAMGIRKFRRPTLIGGALLGAALASRGIDMALGEKRKDRLGLTGEVVSTAASAAAAAGGAALYYKGLGLTFRKAVVYGNALRKGTLAKLPRIPIKTKYGQLRFDF